jgi:hypothetical protein
VGGVEVDDGLRDRHDVDVVVHGGEVAARGG